MAVGAEYVMEVVAVVVEMRGMDNWDLGGIVVVESVVAVGAGAGGGGGET